MFQLPKEIQNYIFQYNAEHRELLNEVLSELFDYVNYAICDNDMCEKDIYTMHDEYHVKEIAGIERTFCSEHCLSYGSWTILYDLRERR
jgi:hypothetical protein